MDAVEPARPKPLLDSGGPDARSDQLPMRHDAVLGVRERGDGHIHRG
jgi:hypothetical protein